MNNYYIVRVFVIAIKHKHIYTYIYIYPEFRPSRRYHHPSIHTTLWRLSSSIYIFCWLYSTTLQLKLCKNYTCHPSIIIIEQTIEPSTVNNKYCKKKNKTNSGQMRISDDNCLHFVNKQTNKQIKPLLHTKTREIHVWKGRESNNIEKKKTQMRERKMNSAYNHTILV